MRASDADREHTVALLGERFAEGYLSTDTFTLRIACAYSAKTSDELEALERDLPQRRRVWDRLRCALLRQAVQLPRAGELTYVGRSRTCDVVLADPTVSRVHAAIEATRDGWTLRDLGTTNGTWLDGQRVARVAVRPGSLLRLGECRVVLQR